MRIGPAMVYHMDMERNGIDRIDPEEEGDQVPTTLVELPNKLWLTIPEAGAVFGLKPAASYNAANKGDFPLIQVGGKRVVPTAKLKEMLGLSE